MVFFKIDDDGVHLFFPKNRDGVITAIVAVERTIEHLEEYERDVAELKRFAKFLRELKVNDIQ